MSKTKAETLFANMRIPVIAAPMFLVSTPQMVIEACKSGIVGTIPLLNARTEAILEQWLDQINHELKQAKQQHPQRKIAPWGVNLIVHKSNRRFDIDLEMIREFKPPVVITALGNPHRVADIVHEYGGLVFSDVATLSQAKKAAQTGVDGLILVCGGAGGHGGTLNPIAFIGAVKKFWNGITILAGSISNGQDVLGAKALGADFAYMGTRFITSKEANADEEYQNMIMEGTIEDILYTDAFNGIPANYLIPSIKKAGIDSNHLPARGKGKVDVLHLTDANAKPWKNIRSAGQGITVIDQVLPVSKIVDDLEKEYQDALSNLFSNTHVNN